MNRATFLGFVFVIVAIGVTTVWYLIDSRNTMLGSREPISFEEPTLDDSLAIYTNGPYGFSIFYPEYADVSYEFDPTYHVGTAWRVNALPESVGDPLIAIVPYSTESDRSYPRYFHAMVRIGASIDPLEVERCEDPSAEQGEISLPDTVINGHSWKVFSFQSAGMMQYVSGISYRTVLDQTCIALEQLQTGSSYREDPSSKSDVKDELLQSEYEKLTEIVRSFRFAR